MLVINKALNIPVVAQWLSPMVQTVLRTIQIPQSLVDKVVAAPVMQVAGLSGRAGRLFPVVTEADPHGLSDHRDSPVARGHVVDALFCAGRSHAVVCSEKPSISLS